MKKKRIVVKIGTSLITTRNGRINFNRMRDIVGQISALAKTGYEMALVSSGAIAAGSERLNLDCRPQEIPKLQASAAVGQGLLFKKYASLFLKEELTIGQILLTQFDTTHRRQYLNARNTLNELIKMNIVPLINENDTTAVDEICFGDNDTLAALVTVLVEADLLIILSDISGLHTADPRKHKEAKLIKTVDEISPEIEAMAEGIGSHFGSGGMVTKINAARIVTAARAGLVIADGRRPDVLREALNQRTGTYFKPAKKRISSRKLWIAYGKITAGTIIIDDGAARAISDRGKSLLPAGVVGLEGNFKVGDAVDISGPGKKLVGRGLTNYAADELKIIKGKRSSEISGVDNGESAEEVIHRDCLVIF